MDYGEAKTAGTLQAIGREPKMSDRLDAMIAALEEQLARLRQAKDVLARNPDFEFLSDTLRRL